MTDGKLVALALLSIAVGLGGVTWAIHDHTERHARYQWDVGWRVDTVTGAIERCTQIVDELGECEPWVDGPVNP